MAAATRMIEAGKPGNLAFQLIEDGQPVDGRFVSIASLWIATRCSRSPR